MSCNIVYKGISMPIEDFKEYLREIIKEEENSQTPSNMSEFTNHSGGAKGADSLWDDIGKEYGMVNNNHYWADNITTTDRGNKEITPKDYQEGRFEAAKAASRNFGYPYKAMKNSLLIRNWSQVKYSDSVFAIGKIVKPGEIIFPNTSGDERKALTPSVTGGTGYAVGMAINHNKPVYVYNQVDGSYPKGWYKWDNDSNDFIPTETPTLTKNFAGIGTRYVNEDGKQAIREVYEKTKSLINKKENNNSNTENTPNFSQIINIYAGTNENTHLSNFAERPFKVDFYKYKNVEQAFQQTKFRRLLYYINERYKETSKKVLTEGEKESVYKLQDKILNSRSPAQIKKLGATKVVFENKQLQSFVNEFFEKGGAWDLQKAEVMKGFIKESFEQNPEALQQLLNTGNATLTHTQDKSEWKTLFPKLLMEVREELRPNIENNGNKLLPIKINQFQYTLNIETGELFFNSKTKGDIIETNKRKIGKVYTEYARQNNLPTKEFNKHLYAKVFGKVVNISNGNFVEQKQILDLFKEEVKTQKKEVKNKSVINYEDLNDNQKQAYNEIIEFVKDPNRSTHSLIGFAGTGKTTLLNLVFKELNKDHSILFSSPTHKANTVIKSSVKGSEVATIHSILGLMPNFEILNFSSKDIQFENTDRDEDKYSFNVLIVDESSMINDSLYEALKEYALEKGAKIIFVGDSAQLKPVKQNTESKALSSTDSQSKLTQVMRADNDSLLEESMKIRETGGLTYETNITPEGKGIEYVEEENFEKEAIEKFNSPEARQDIDFVKILAGTNKRVEELNNLVRESIYGKLADQWEKGEIVTGYIDIKGKIQNSIDYKIQEVRKTTKEIAGLNLPVYEIYFENSQSPIIVLDKNITQTDLEHLAKTFENYRQQAIKTRNWRQFYNFMNSFISPVDIKLNGVTKIKKGIDYGYAQTIHKSQGSTYKYVFLDDVSIDAFPEEEIKSQLRYVGVTRAKSKVTIYSNKGKSTTKLNPLNNKVNKGKLTFSSFNSKDKTIKKGTYVSIKVEGEEKNYIVLEKSTDNKHIVLDPVANKKYKVQSSRLIPKGSFKVMNYQGGEFIVTDKNIFSLSKDFQLNEENKEEIKNKAKEESVKDYIETQLKNYNKIFIPNENLNDLIIKKVIKDKVKEIHKLDSISPSAIETFTYVEPTQGGENITILPPHNGIKVPLDLFSSSSNSFEAKSNLSFKEDNTMFNCQ